MASTIGTIDSSNNGSAVDFKYETGRYDKAKVLFHYDNGLDVDVDIDVDATILSDKSNFNKSVELRGGDEAGTPGTLTVSSGSVDSDYVTEPWDVFKINVNPASSPSSGTFTLSQMSELG